MIKKEATLMTFHNPLRVNNHGWLHPSGMTNHDAGLF